MSRRRFLQAVGAAGGAGAVLASMEVLGLAPDVLRHKRVFRAPRSSDFHLQCRVNDTSVLVLGAGDAGLAAAYELGKAGYRCEVLEARSRPGGRCWSVRGGVEHTDLTGSSQRSRFADGLYLNAGPARIPQHHTTLDYCRELAVPIEVFINANPDAFVYREADVGSSGPLTGRPIRRRAAKADYAGYVGELLAKCTRQGALNAVLGPDDRDALVEYLRSYGVLGRGDRYVGSADRGYTTPPGAADQAGSIAAPYDVSALLASGLGISFAFDQEWDQAMPMFQPVGGMDRIPYALAAAVPGQIRYDAAVNRIQILDDRVDVDYTDATGSTYRVSADYCVCTIPPTVLRKIGFHGERGVLVGYYNYFDDSDRFAAMSPQDRERRALAQGAKLHGEAYQKDFESSFSVHWQNQPFSEGGWALWPDRTAPSYQALLQPVERLYFAGDHLSQVTAWQHGAFESARHVVTQLHDRVLSAGAGCPR